MPRFTEQVESAVEALSANPSLPVDENEFIDASRLVYDGIRDIRKAVLMIRVSCTVPSAMLDFSENIFGLLPDLYYQEEEHFDGHLCFFYLTRIEYLKFKPTYSKLTFKISTFFVWKAALLSISCFFLVSRINLNHIFHRTFTRKNSFPMATIQLVMFTIWISCIRNDKRNHFRNPWCHFENIHK